MSKFILTTGDQDGIGPEVTVKALKRLAGRMGSMPIVWRSRRSVREFAKLGSAFDRVIVDSLSDALEVPHRGSFLIEIESEDSPADWVEISAKAHLKARGLSGLVTAPLSKTLIHESGYKDLGHTEILARVSRQKNLFQGYVGSKFNVVLSTAHAPLAKVPKLLSADIIERSCRAAHQLRKAVGGRDSLPLGVLGLNPHAGEKGLIGSEDAMVAKAVARLRKAKIKAEGPLVPDAAFLEKNWKKYAVFVCLYHDQGLIPFKMIHGKGSGAQVTLGLPFVRTSVDHGTAKDLFGKNAADPGSMIDAIKLCLRFSAGGFHV